MRPKPWTHYVKLVATAVRALDEPSLREQMGEFGHLRVLRELSWEHESKRLIEFYGGVLGVGRTATRRH